MSVPTPAVSQGLRQDPTESPTQAPIQPISQGDYQYAEATIRLDSTSMTEFLGLQAAYSEALALVTFAADQDISVLGVATDPKTHL